MNSPPNFEESAENVKLEQVRYSQASLTGIDALVITLTSFVVEVEDLVMREEVSRIMRNLKNLNLLLATACYALVEIFKKKDQVSNSLEKLNNESHLKAISVFWYTKDIHKLHLFYADITKKSTGLLYSPSLNKIQKCRAILSRIKYPREDQEKVRRILSGYDDPFLLVNSLASNFASSAQVQSFLAGLIENLRVAKSQSDQLALYQSVDKIKRTYISMEKSGFYNLDHSYSNFFDILRLNNIKSKFTIYAQNQFSLRISKIELKNARKLQESSEGDRSELLSPGDNKLSPSAWRDEFWLFIEEQMIFTRDALESKQNYPSKSQKSYLYDLSLIHI